MSELTLTFSDASVHGEELRELAEVVRRSGGRVEPFRNDGFFQVPDGLSLVLPDEIRDRVRQELLGKTIGARECFARPLLEWAGLDLAEGRVVDK